MEQRTDLTRMVEHVLTVSERSAEPRDLTSFSSFELARLLTRATIDNDEVYPVVQKLTHRLLSFKRRNSATSRQQTVRLLKSVVKQRILDRIPEPVLDKVKNVVCSNIEKARINTMTKEDALLVLLYQMLFNYNDREMEEHTNMCYSRIGKLPKKFRAGIIAYTNTALLLKEKSREKS